MGRFRHIRLRAGTLAVVVGLIGVAGAVSACGSSSSSNSSSSSTSSSGAQTSSSSSGTTSKGAIKVAGIFTNTPYPFGVDAEKMVQAVFSQTNSAGGIGGRKLVFLGGDDNESTSTATQLVREYSGDGVVGYVGSASFVDCGINGPYYSQNNLVSITAVGVNTQCYSSPNIASVEPSPYQQITASLYYAYKYLHDTKNCLFQPLTPGAAAGVSAAVNAYEQVTGNKLTIDNTSIPASSTLSAATVDPLLIQAKDAGCQSFFYGGADDVEASTILSQAKSQGMQKVDFLGASISYTEPLATTAAKDGVPFYATTALYPFSVPSSRNAGFRSTAKQYGVNMTEFSADAYVAAEWFVSALKAIHGPITASSVTAYFKAGHPYPTQMSPDPLVFGSGSTHEAVISEPSVVKLTSSGWKLALFGLSVPH